MCMREGIGCPTYIPRERERLREERKEASRCLQ